MAARTETIKLGYSPREWQRNVHLALKRFSVLVVHRRGGKTVMSLTELVDKALRCSLPMGRYGYIAPQRNQAKKIAWEYLKEYAKKIPGTIKNESELYVEFPNGARVELFGADNPDAIRGAYFDGVVLDEYADMHEAIWKKVVRPMLADRKGWAIFIGTPKGHDNFYEMLKLANKRMAEGRNWYATVLPHWETGVLPQSELDDALEEMGEDAFAQEFCCDFSVEASNAMIPIKLVEAAMGKHIDKKDYARAGKVIGVDVARFGDDRSVIQKRQGRYVHEPIILKQLDNMEVADRVAHEINNFKPDAVFIDAGRGEGVIDRLRQLGYDVIEVPFGGRSPDTKFFNKVTYMWAQLKQALRDGLCLPDMPEYLTELTARLYDFKPDGKVALEPKDKMKERFRSPDLGDALALTYAQHVEPYVDILDNRPVNQVTQADLEYDPY